MDPLTSGYPFYTPYQFASNTPIGASDLDGLEANPDFKPDVKYNPRLKPAGEAKIIQHPATKKILEKSIGRVLLRRVPWVGPALIVYDIFDINPICPGCPDLGLDNSTNPPRDATFVDPQFELKMEGLDSPFFNPAGNPSESPNSNEDEDEDAFVTFYRGARFYPGFSTVAKQNFLESIDQARQISNPNIDLKRLYLTRSESQAAYWATTQGGMKDPNGYMVLQITFKESEWEKFKIENPKVVERMVAQPPKKGEIWTEVVVPLESIPSFQVKASTPIVISQEIDP